MANEVIFSIINMFFVENLTDPILTLALSRDGTSESSGYGGIIEIGGVLDLKLPASPINERVYEFVVLSAFAGTRRAVNHHTGTHTSPIAPHTTNADRHP